MFAWLRGKPRRTDDAPLEIGWTPVAVRRPVHPALRPTALPTLAAPSVVVREDPRAVFDPELAEGDTAFCSVGFRMFMMQSFAEMDRAVRHGARQRADARFALAVQQGRRTARNMNAAAHAVAALNEVTVPRIAKTIVARALHASDSDAPTGLLPAVMA